MNKRLTRISLAITLIGLFVASYMTVYKFTSQELQDAMCVGSKGCSVVNASPYSEVRGVPVAVLGVLGYLALLAVQLLERRPGIVQENGALIFFGISVTGFLFTVYLIFVEVALIKAYCPFCITSQVAMTLLFVISVIRLIKQP
ncbi:MAG TPA: vitamin K epoxide reductase family protein [Anaerolineales bacterium]|jgi:uncharacterized membrane protein|nr:vitamin K epoxide reductase family protein [Anaerolineales bacterium]HQX17845.1 vitamin K epoxide reductase family protein [Anaerolineales bacterium]